MDRERAFLFGLSSSLERDSIEWEWVFEVVGM